MQHHDDTNEPRLSAELMAALKTHPAPDTPLEDRIVAALHARGTLREATFESPARNRMRTRPRAPWVAAAAAAAIVVFMLGVQVGGRNAALADGRDARPGAADNNAGTVAGQLQASAVSYANALALVQPVDSAATTAAIETFRAAADEIMRIAPESNVAFAMQIAYPNSRVTSSGGLATLAPPSTLIWF
jgi:hypothetical protein